MTPTTVNGAPSIITVRPITARSAANLRVHNP
jgi:hypothetical protein